MIQDGYAIRWKKEVGQSLQLFLLSNIEYRAKKSGLILIFLIRNRIIKNRRDDYGLLFLDFLKDLGFCGSKKHNLLPMMHRFMDMVPRLGFLMILIMKPTSCPCYDVHVYASSNNTLAFYSNYWN